MNAVTKQECITVEKSEFCGEAFFQAYMDGLPELVQFGNTAEEAEENLLSNIKIKRHFFVIKGKGEELFKQL